MNRVNVNISTETVMRSADCSHGRLLLKVSVKILQVRVSNVGIISKRFCWVHHRSQLFKKLLEDKVNIVIKYNIHNSYLHCYRRQIF